MNNSQPATKQDIQNSRKQTKQDIQKLRKQTKQDIQKLRKQTKQDIQKLRKQTKQDIQKLSEQIEKNTERIDQLGKDLEAHKWEIDKKLDKKFQKVENLIIEFKSDIFDRFDDIMQELKTSREERTVMNYHITNNKETLEEHDQRIGKLEKSASFQVHDE